MPYRNEHACRLRDPRDFAAGTFRSTRRSHGSQAYRVIMGKLKGHSGPGDPMVEQTYRYPTAEWTPEEAQAHCAAHEGALFEPAAGGAATSATAPGSSDEDV